MPARPKKAESLLPKSWPGIARRAVLHVISMASTAATIVRGQKASKHAKRRSPVVNAEQLEAEIALLREEIRIKDRRMETLLPNRRPRYKPTDRMAILELRARRGWTLAETARRFLVEPKTIASWMQRLDEEGERTLVQTSMPLNKYPDFVRYLVQRLKVLCPTMGKRKIAETLARAGLHLGSTTVQRMVNAVGPEPATDADTKHDEEATKVSGRTVIANYPNHVYGVDLTVVVTMAGFWTMLSPFAWLQRWPFCYWVAVAIDHFSRRVIGFAVFLKPPSTADVNAFLGRAIRTTGKKPKYFITDQGGQFDSDAFRSWCRRHDIRPRYGAVGKYGSLGVIERFIKSLKNECTRRIIIPARCDAFRREVLHYVAWYNGCRPHATLFGRTPDEVYYERPPANEEPRYEPRRHWPRDSRCVDPQAPIKGRRGVRLQLAVSYLEGRMHLPVVELKRAG